MASEWWFCKLALLLLTINSSKDVSLNIGPSCKWSLRLTQLPIPEGYRNEIAKKWRLQLKPFTNYRLNGFIWLVVFDHFFHILGIIIPSDFHIFQRGWNHQPVLFFNVSKKTEEGHPSSMIPHVRRFPTAVNIAISLSVSCIQATI